MAKKMISLSIDEDVLSGIDEVAANMGLSRSALINLQLRAFNEGDVKSATQIMAQMIGSLSERKKTKKRAASTGRRPKSTTA